MCTVCLSVRLPTAFRRQEGRQQQGGGGREGGSVDKFQCLAFPPGNPTLGCPPLPFLSLSLKHVPSKPLLYRHPQWNQAQICCQEGPTFLRLATLKGPTQACTQVLPPCPSPVNVQATGNTQRHGWTQRHLCTQEAGAHLTSGGCTEKYKCRPPPPLPSSTHHRPTWFSITLHIQTHTHRHT